MRIKNIFVLLCLCVVAAVACSHNSSAPESSQRAEPSLPYTPSLDVTSMDRSVNPCEDFYTYSCGRWMKNNPIPSDQTSWSVYGKLYQDNLNYLRGILDEASTAKNRDTVTQEIGDYYAANDVALFTQILTYMRVTNDWYPFDLWVRRWLYVCVHVSCASACVLLVPVACV